MSPENSKIEEQAVDPFIYSEVFKAPEKAFLRQHKGFVAVQPSCTYVIDTNALLVPFGVSTRSLDEIKTIYDRLVRAARIFIPKQCAREFLKNRPIKVREIHEQINTALSTLPAVREIPQWSLESLPEYTACIGQTKILKEQIKAYKKSLEDLRAAVHKWNFNDPISTLYSNVFAEDNFCDHSKTSKELLEDCALRFAHSLPPGYKDKGKKDSGVGDVAIWQTILDLGRRTKKDLVFVTNDEKADWVVRAADQAICARYELVEEYFREAGAEFFIISFSKFLDVEGASEPTVSQAAESALKSSLSSATFDLGARTEALDLELADLEECLEGVIAGYGADDSEYVYIQDKDAIVTIELAYASLAREADKDRYQATVRGLIKRISEDLQEICSLNGILKYLEARMKHSGDAESAQQLELCKTALHQTKILRGIRSRYL